MPRNTNLNKAAQALHLPEPPATLSPAERRLWKTSVSARPADTWSPVDKTLLALFVRAATDVERLTVEIGRHGEIADGRVSPRVLVRAAREKLVLDVAKRLRLTPCSRYTAARVGELHRHATKAREAASNYEADTDLLASPTPRNLQ